MTETKAQEQALIRNTLFVYFVSGAAAMLMGNLMPFLRDLYGINYAYTGFLLSLPSWGNVASVFLTGYLPTYIGRRKTVLTTSVWMVIAFAIVTSGLGGAAILPFACLMIGFARGGNTNFANTMMSTLSGKQSAVGFNLLHSAFAMGAVLSPLALVACTSANPNGWRIMGTGIVLLCIAQVVVYLRMPMPAEKITRSIKSIDRSFLRSRNFWVCSAVIFFYISAEYAIVNWLVTYFKDTGILSAQTAQMMSSLLWVVIFIGRFGGAYLLRWISRSVILAIDGIGLMAAFLLVFLSRTPTPIFIGIMGVGLFMATIYTIALAMGTERMRGNDVGVSTMILIGCIGGIVTPALVGMVAERAGIQAGMGVVVAVTVLLLITILCSVFMKGDSET